MHQINLIHMDIKPENIMFSTVYSKYVFIDFGLSMFVKEKLGFKTTTHFVGSLKYSTKEMAESFYSLHKTSVDLYYNDLHCLK
jgi:serine/threonine protein kinase